MLLVIPWWILLCTCSVPVIMYMGKGHSPKRCALNILCCLISRMPCLTQETLTQRCDDVAQLPGCLIPEPPCICQLRSSCLPKAAPGYAEAIQDLQASMGCKASQSGIESSLSVHHLQPTPASSGEMWVAM